MQCPGFSPVGVSSTLMFCWCWGPRWAAQWEEPLPWGPGVAGGWVTLQAVLGCMQAHRLDMSALPCTLSWLLVLLVCWFFICISFSCGGFSNHLRYTVSFGNFQLACLRGRGPLSLSILFSSKLLNSAFWIYTFFCCYFHLLVSLHFSFFFHPRFSVVTLPYSFCFFLCI